MLLTPGMGHRACQAPGSGRAHHLHVHDTVGAVPIDLSDLPLSATIETLMSEGCARLVPVLTGLSLGLTETTRLVAYVDDLFGADSFDAARSEM
ncbi:putative hydroquinone glucosyltransferase [Hordeum vulgare]|nr:putative hydroquinone glucosyltransferase [Hordeum vulgare]